MAMLREWLLRLWGALRRDSTDEDIERELRFHLEHAEEELRAKGHPATEAARLARARLGGLPQAMEALRDQRGLPWLDDLRTDVRIGVRGLARRPGFTANGGAGARVRHRRKHDGVHHRERRNPGAPHGRAGPHRAARRARRVAAPGPRIAPRARGVRAPPRRWPASPLSARRWRPSAREARHPSRWPAPTCPPPRSILLGERPALGRTFLPEDDSPGAPVVALLAMPCGAVASGATRRFSTARSPSMTCRSPSSASCLQASGSRWWPTCGSPFRRCPDTGRIATRA